MSINLNALTSIGWGPYFQQQLCSDDWDSCLVFRVVAVHRGQLTLSNGERDVTLSLSGKMLTQDRLQQATIGDWVMLSREDGAFVRLLGRKSLFKRKAAGTANLHQMVAANVDTLFIVTSCNDDFNLSRLERYLALAYAAEVTPVVILTKVDLCDSPEEYISQVKSLDRDLMVEAVNALDTTDMSVVHGWCKRGQTVALMGSSGVGKSTLANSLGAEAQKVGGIREGDAKGRHTTTHRSLLQLKDGAILLDSPGMRELQITDCEEGVTAVFADIDLLSQSCRFKDCAHKGEPHCAVQDAIEGGTLAPRRLKNYNKLMAEQRYNSSTLAERRKSDKTFGKHIKSALAAKKSKQIF